MSKGCLALCFVTLFGLSAPFVGGCGSKSGLTVPAYDAGPVDSVVPPDTPTDVPVPQCTVFSATAELLPLDVFMLFDASGSMQEETDDGTTKWRAVRRAIARFFNASDSRGIGVALTFYPQVQSDLPLLCEEDAECGMADACLPATACIRGRVLCNTVTDCVIRGFPRDSCEPIGYCSGAGPMSSSCTFEGSFPCPDGTGTCIPLGVCENRDTCDVAAYSTPAAGPLELPDGRRELLDAYDAREVPRSEAGGTPTLPGVTGTVAGAVQWARDNPTHKVVVVVATDGFPTSCDPGLRVSFDTGIDNVAAAAAGGLADAMIETFVIGVFGDEERDLAQLSLDRVAVAGGTETAFVVDTSSTLSNELVDALNQVRLDATACDFALTDTVPLSTEPAFARISRGGEERWVERVDGPDACRDGGFYFADLGTGSATRVGLCPGSCAFLGATPDRELEVFTRCPGDPRGP